MPEARILVVMGVSGCGKTTLGKALGRALHAPFLDADDFHPEANRARMAAGVPLEDEDRWPWLDALGEALRAAAQPKGVAVAACSALKRSYRQRLVERAGEPILFVHLTGAPDLLASRLATRSGHFMPASLLESQLATLEPPAPDETALSIDIALPTDKQLALVLKALPHLRSFRRKQ